jgi:twinkle protein
VTGIPGSGKSTYIRWTLIQYLKNNPEERIGFYSPEQRPYGREVIKMMEVYCKKPISVMTEGEKREAMDFLNDHICFIVPNKNSYKDFTKIKSAGDINTVTSILDYTEALKRTMNISGIVIDAWNKLEHEIPRGDTEHNYTGKVLDAIINFNESCGIFTIIIAHPTKTQQKPSGNYQRPSLYSISGSAHWYNKADVGIIVHRDKYSEKEGAEGYYFDETLPSVVYVDKMKFEEIGREGYFELNYDKSSNTYKDYMAPAEKAQPKEIVASNNTAIPVDYPTYEDELPF